MMMEYHHQDKIHKNKKKFMRYSTLRQKQNLNKKEIAKLRKKNSGHGNF